jgi:hypothetical protein
MRIRFRPAERGPQRLLSEAEIHFEDGPLMGTRLLGFGVWRDPKGMLYVTFPSRAIVSGGQRRYIDYLRNLEGQDEAVRQVKAWIVEEYRRQVGAA